MRKTEEEQGCGSFLVVGRWVSFCRSVVSSLFLLFFVGSCGVRSLLRCCVAALRRLFPGFHGFLCFYVAFFAFLSLTSPKNAFFSHLTFHNSHNFFVIRSHKKAKEATHKQLTTHTERKKSVP